MLQDAVGRTVSAHNMKSHANGKCHGDQCVKEYGSLLQEFTKAKNLDIVWPEDLDGCNFNEWVRVPVVYITAKLKRKSTHIAQVSPFSPLWLKDLLPPQGPVNA